MIDIIPATIRAIADRLPSIVPHLTRDAKLLFAIKADLGKVNAVYHDAITSSLVDYFEGGGIAPSRNAFKRAMVEAFGNSFDAGWIDGGGELPIDDDAMAWMEARLNEEAGYIDGLFQEAKELRKDKELDYFAWITAKADGYVHTLASIYNAARMLANDRQMLTWHLGQTEKHCRDCAKLNGKRHRASWYIERNYIPRQPDAAMECHGYNCDCYLTDPKGNEVTI